MKLWSITTTVRNPERIRDFLRILKIFENQEFNKANQIKYQILLIQNKLYLPHNIPSKYLNLFNDPKAYLSYEIAEDIFYIQEYEDPPMRGRQSANPLNKLGFAIAREKEGKVKITELGKHFLSDEYDIGKIFFKSLLKLQFPNPWDKHFTKNKGFNIKPLIATIQLINIVNKISDKRGLSHNEFCLFIPSLINFEQIETYSKNVIEYRMLTKKKEYKIDFAKQFYGTTNLTEKQLKNFEEYGDNIMRYFRLTRYFRIITDPFGKHWRIDLEPIRNAEISQMITNYSGRAQEFDSLNQYLEYMSDISQPKLPWEEEENLKQIANSLVVDVKSFVEANNIEMDDTDSNIMLTDLSSLIKNNLDKFIDKIREIKVKLIGQKKRKDLITNIPKIESIIEIFKNNREIKKFKPEQFEKIITESLWIINDEKEIKPNYPTDDNGEPISHAPGNKADIECYYKSFNVMCEVTLDTSNFQWIRETQPVMRHLRDFETNNPNILNYCLFVSPKIHNDTLGQFWFAIKSGYDGTKQKIIPISTNQFSILLETVVSLHKKNRKISNKDIQKLYILILNETEKYFGHNEWYNKIDGIIESWKNKLIEQ